MKNDNIIDTPETEQKELYIKDMILWWEKKRLYYNIILIIVIAYMSIDFLDSIKERGPYQLIKYSLFHVFGANLFYTLGWGPAVILYFTFKYKGLMNKGRWALLILGTLFSIIWLSAITSLLLFDFYYL